MTHHDAFRRGFTLLEVLVASAILVLGLSGIAAILPAAATQFNEALLEGRARTLVQNAFSDLECRGMFAASLFANVPYNSGQLLMIGDFRAGAAENYVVSGDPFASKEATSQFFTPDPNVIGPVFLAAGWPPPDILRKQGITSENARNFNIEDDLIGSPANGTNVGQVFDANGEGPRSFRRGMFWTAFILPSSPHTPTPGTLATVTVAILRKPMDPIAIDLIPPGEPLPGTKEEKSIFYTVAPNQTSISKLLEPGDTVLLLRNGLPPSPHWLRVQASWTKREKHWQTGELLDRTYVSFADDFDLKAYHRSTGQSAPNLQNVLCVLGLPGLIRIEQRTVRLR